MALTITGVSPTTGPNTGGTLVTITGTDLNTVTTLTIGGTAAPDFEIVGPTLIRALTPVHANGAVSIVIGDGSTTQTLASSFTYANPAVDATLTATNARKWRCDVNTGAIGSPVWTQVRAITAFQPTVTPTLQDDSDYDSDGWGADAKTMLKWGLTATISRKLGVTSGNYDPGQERIRAAHDKFSVDGVVQVRWYDREGGPEAYTGFAQVSWEPQGGGTDAVDTVNITLSGQGARTEIINPAA